MNLQKLILTKNDCYKVGAAMTPKGIMVHSTGANNPNLCRYVGPDDGKLGVNRYNNHWNRGNSSACVHAFIGKLADGSIATYQTLPWNMKGWHAGGAANNTHISFEICEDGLTDKKYFLAVYTEAVELCAYLCEKYNLDPLKDGVLIAHYEGYKRGVASNHGDPKRWFANHGKNMDIFRADVKARMTGGKVEIKEEVTLTPAHNYKVSVLEWQKAAIADGFEFPKFGADGIWGDECVSVAKNAIVKRRSKYTYHNLTKLVQRVVGVDTDGLCGPATAKAIKEYQKKHGLVADACVGINTWRKMLGVK